MSGVQDRAPGKWSQKPDPAWIWAWRKNPRHCLEILTLTGRHAWAGPKLNRGSEKIVESWKVEVGSLRSAYGYVRLRSAGPYSGPGFCESS